MIRNTPSHGGWLEVVCGPMFSGKSEELIRRLRRAEIAGQRALIIKAGIDDRYDVAHVVTHAGAKMCAVNATNAHEVRRFSEGYEVVGVDELHFFDGDVAAACVEMAERGQRVVVAGLDMDFRAEPFDAITDLMARAEFVDKLQAVCHRCGGPATRTQRLVAGRPAPFSGETIQVGALDAYEARCRDCYEPGHDRHSTGSRPSLAHG